MSGKDNPCKKFQANIFNKSKCQNCFKPRESHLLSDEDLNQAKPIYGGWLLLAPEGTDFDNPVHRSRKWQRRFFILYEHGLLRYALDEMPTTLPQGTINMNQCTDVIDGENRTGQKYSLCILTPEEHFIRAENKEIINGWLEMLIVYPKTNKQNQKKKRKVEPPTPQEPGPAKMAATSTGIPSAEKVPATKSTLWQEESQSKETQESSSGGSSPGQMPSSLSEPMSEGKADGGLVNGDRTDGGRKTRVESGYFSLEKTKDLKSEEQSPQTPPSPSTPDAPSRRSVVIEKFEALDIEKAESMETSCPAAPSGEARQGRSEKRSFPRKRDESGVGSIPDVSASSISPYRRAKSLDRRSTESSMTPDLLNFKKGWLTKQYHDGQWKKHWFVLTDQTLRYYRDSVAEEAADLDGEIDLSTCHDVTEYPVQRNYGFQIHTKEGEFTLSAMTSGIRRNWIQTIMKHVRPSTAPDVTSSLPEERSKVSSFSPSSMPIDKLDSAEHSDADVEQKRSRARERRREGRSKTFDWAEFRPMQQALAQERAQAAEAMKSISSYDTTDSNSDLGELERERARRREERRKRFESSDSVEESTVEDTSRMEVDRGLASDSMDIRPNVQVEIEQRWQQVETTPLREEKQIPISPLPAGPQKHPSEDIVSLLEKQLEQSQREVSDLLAENLVLQQRLKEALEQQQSARDGYVLQATCERGFAAMEETHQKKLEDLQRQHQRELEKLREEKDRLLAEETAATISAIEAMKNAHREELERELEKNQRSQISSVNADVESLRRQYLEELHSIQRELEVLSEQYSQKCLENAHLAQALEAERQALRQCQRENQELNAHNQELNNRLASEITRLRTLVTGEGGEISPLTQGKDVYELEVLLRVKESEIQYQKQEINSLKDELQTALRDKKYTSDKYKDIYTELSNAKAKAECDISRLKEQLKAAVEMLGDKSPESASVSGYDIMKSKSNPDFLKNDRSSINRQLRNIRSKSVIEQVSWDN
ncbi:myosin phosphatase Rho-interacting protein isoform X2 [Spea bombifrons]|uniref:myosin phosphatase Rho-interacting protein isoform X2 n=1 Tax=Spea bombifrons TaxID=233779 RepID=UPI00234A6072|nr:myosin phosphatase Rho-interacting protein isoform X2 [Spea bombifrons]XP_053327370.1 myosin phosphatase Rho-interacting protein isoform X2 [Spea bombifrons]